MPTSVSKYLEAYCTNRRDISKSDLASAFIGYGSCVRIMYTLYEEDGKKGIFEKKPKKDVEMWKLSKAVWEHASEVSRIAYAATDELNDSKNTCVSLNSAAYDLVHQWRDEEGDRTIGEMTRILLWFGYVNELVSLNTLQKKNRPASAEMPICRVWTFADEDRFVKDKDMNKKQTLIHGINKSFMLVNINPNNLLVGRDALIRILRKADEPGAYEKIWQVDNFLNKYLINTPKSKGAANVIKN